MKQEILSLLRERGDYVSGQEICEKYKVSRTAVWKAIEQLKKEGYVIDAVRNKGYSLKDCADIYSKAEIDSFMDTDYIGRNTFFYNEIGSTNVEAKRLAEEGACEGTLVVADCQTAGRGRRGKDWISPAGVNAYFTLMLRPDINPDKAPMMTLIMALAVAKAVEELNPLQAEAVKIKWPNDVVVDGKKICGILTEMSVERDYIHYVVIGVGINVKLQAFDPEFADRATSLEAEWGSGISRSKLVAVIQKHFEYYYKHFVEDQNLSFIKDDYEKMLVNKSAEVRVLDPKGEYTGTALGIDECGELLVRKENGEVTSVYAGEVSVRGIYGYV